jgi:uncharacterized protein
MKQLHISKDLSLPLGIANKTICIFGKGGSGKSNLEVVLAEELYGAGIPTCIVDPADVHYGIKSARDGKSAGLPFIIFGGLHADVPIYPENGVLLADLFLDRGLYMVIVTQPWTGGERARFMTDFANQLYKRGPEKEQRGSARVLLLEEAHEYVPLSPGKDEAVMLGAMKRLYTVGRNYWIGFIAATRRPARMHTDLRNGADATAFFQIVGTQDRKAMTDYLGEMAEKDVRDEIIAHVAKLPVGTAYFYQPHETPALQRVHFRYRDTFDTTTTEITAGHKAVKPVLATVDLSKLGEAMEAAREKAKAEDPRELKKSINELRAQVRKLESSSAPAEVKTQVSTKTVEKRVVIEGTVARLEKLLDRSEKLRDSLAGGVGAINEEVASIAGLLTSARAINEPVPQRVSSPTIREGVAASSTPRPIQRRAAPIPRNANGNLPIGEEKILSALIQYPNGLERNQLTVLTGYKRSTRDRYLQYLAEKEYAIGSGGKMFATETGRAALPNAEPLPTGQALQDYWLNRLPEGERAILDVLIGAYPNAVERDAISDRTGYKRSTRDRYLQYLANKELVAAGRGEAKASDNLFIE